MTLKLLGKPEISVSVIFLAEEMKLVTLNYILNTPQFSMADQNSQPEARQWLRKLRLTRVPRLFAFLLPRLALACGWRAPRRREDSTGCSFED